MYDFEKSTMLLLLLVPLPLKGNKVFPTKFMKIKPIPPKNIIRFILKKSKFTPYILKNNTTYC